MLQEITQISVIPTILTPPLTSEKCYYLSFLGCFAYLSETNKQVWRMS